MALDKASIKSRTCVSCDNWFSNMRTTTPDKQYVLYQGNSKAVCVGGERDRNKTGPNEKCRMWKQIRKARRMAPEMEEKVRKFLEEEKKKKEQISSAPPEAE